MDSSNPTTQTPILLLAPTHSCMLGLLRRTIILPTFHVQVVLFQGLRRRVFLEMTV